MPYVSRNRTLRMQKYGFKPKISKNHGSFLYSKSKLYYTYPFRDEETSSWFLDNILGFRQGWDLYYVFTICIQSRAVFEEVAF